MKKSEILEGNTYCSKNMTSTGRLVIFINNTSDYLYYRDVNVLIGDIAIVKGPRKQIKVKSFANWADMGYILGVYREFSVDVDKSGCLFSLSQGGY